jgi:hypothetical protein
MGLRVASRVARIGFPLAALIGIAAHAGCGSSGNDGNNAGGGSGDDGGLDGTFANDGPSFFNDANGGCHTSADCNGGVCIAGTGQCCASAAAVCAGACCAAGSVCLFDQCVVPGKDCHSGNDCDPGQYCEPGLGSGDAGPAPAPDAGCTQPLPVGGKCLPLPPTCGDGGAASGDGGCIEDCEYHPPSGGPLSAIPKWTWGPTATAFPDSTDVWSTPTIGRIHDDNCDGVVNDLDSPNVVFVSGSAKDANGVGTCCQCDGKTPTACHKGVLRMLDGATGQEIWSLDKASPSSAGFMGMSNAIGDVDGDGFVDIVAITGEGYVVVVDRNGNVTRTSDAVVPGSAATDFGWGGGLAIADMDGDGSPEIAFGATVFSTLNGKLHLAWTGAKGTGAPGGAPSEQTSILADVDGNGQLELVAGNTAYKPDGTVLWTNANVADGFDATGDFNKDGTAEVVVVSGGKVWVLDGPTGAIVLGPFTLPGNGDGGAPTVADFDGDGFPEIGVAQANFYSVLKPDYTNKVLKLLWKTQNHDLSSSVTGSTVFDFEGDGKAEVIYADECFLWVFSGPDGSVRFAASHTSFTATEASLLADVDGDGHAEMLMVSNGADPGPSGWKCMSAAGDGGAPVPVTMNGVTWTPGPATAKAYRGLVVFGDSADSWVGTRTLWNEHSYHVSNICDDRDNACSAPNKYGSIPAHEVRNWSLPWLNDFRQNVQDKGIFNAPDAIVALSLDCTSPAVAHVAVRNVGQAGLPAGVNVAVFATPGDAQEGTGTTTQPLLPGQTQVVDVTLDPSAGSSGTYYAKIVIDPNHPTFHECRTDNDQSGSATASCIR